ncbi:zinc protease PQQL-like isoform X2 [Cryptomeria japonica]|uniref:zinc protease PQQL-like isoform X2 n=1 Tax=Cryptomeria japonica TaxID=3369 RepID=UPI0025AC1ABB|nr:zinc protease PQQL-like isoform X2 [Cryptomeria japonica]
MDLLGEATTPLKSHKFKSLKLLNVEPDEAFPQDPFGVHYGVLENGLHYYVRKNAKPRMRAALALGVKVGSVLEEEDERGVAHIVEHLAFSATKKYTNHDMVKFLESIGAEFGPCQNASTSSDETIYELLVPVDKPQLLSQAISVLAEFSTEIRISNEDLEKERGAVLEEYREGRNAMGRMQDAHWLLMMEGSKYADRQPIGLERVIRTVSAETVKGFYRRWYHLKNMAVVAVGDFPDTQGVVDLIKLHFEHKQCLPGPPPTIPVSNVPSHEEPRFSCFAEAEAGGSAVMVSCKIPFSEMKTVGDYREWLAESLFHSALNQRFFKISRQRDPPFFSCSSSADVWVHPVKAYVISASCKERGTIEALESILMEVARIRVHGFSEREIAIARAFMMADIESAYLERDQNQSTSLRDECLQHFFRGEPVVGIDYEAQLQKTLLPHISVAEVSKFANFFRTTCSCVIKTVEPLACATIDEVRATVSKVEDNESNGYISLWDEEHIPDEIVTRKPDPGNIASETDFPEFGATELVLSNGMRICYRCTDFLDDQLVYQLFVTSVVPGDEEVNLVMEMTKEGIRAQERDPFTKFANRVRELNYGNSYFFKPVKVKDLQKVDAKRSCQYFDSCFKDPSTFTVVIIGKIDPAVFLPLILQYLGGIPRPSKPVMHFNRDELKALPFKFPSRTVREVVRSQMQEAQCSVQITFPVELKALHVMEEIHFVGFTTKLLETKIMQALRFKHGQVYSVSVSSFLGGNKPSRMGNVRGDIAVNFSCDPDSSVKLVDISLDVISHLQEEGPSDEDVLTVLEIEQRVHENGLQENGYWLDRMLRGYQSRFYEGDLSTCLKAQDEWRNTVRSSLTRSTTQQALQRILPSPCTKQYTVVVLMPKLPMLQRLKSSLFTSKDRSSIEVKVLIGVGAALVLATVFWQYSRRTKNIA